MAVKLGDEVMAPWGTDGFLYPAIVVMMSDDMVHVVYCDGDESDVDTSSLVMGHEIAVGATVSVNWKGQRKYFMGTVKKRLGRALFFNYEDGDQGWATITQVRVPTAPKS